MPKNTRSMNALNFVVALIVLLVAAIALGNYIGYKNYKADLDRACAPQKSATSCTDFLFNN